MSEFFIENCLEPVPDLRFELSQKMDEKTSLPLVLRYSLLVDHDCEAVFAEKQGEILKKTSGWSRGEFLTCGQCSTLSLRGNQQDRSRTPSTPIWSSRLYQSDRLCSFSHSAFTIL